MIIQMLGYHRALGSLSAPPGALCRDCPRHLKPLGPPPAGFWNTPIGGGNQWLTFDLARDSLAEREPKSTAFIVEPEWQAKRDATEASRPLLNPVSNEISNLRPSRRWSEKGKGRLQAGAAPQRQLRNPGLMEESIASQTQRRGVLSENRPRDFN